MPHSKNRILIRQTTELGEVLLGFESRNRYELFDREGNSIGMAAEQGRGFGRMLLRTFLGRCRRSTIRIFDVSGKETGLGEKPFRFYFHRMDVYERGVRVGAIQRKFSIFDRRFVIEDARGRELLRIHSALFRIWTFKLMLDGREVGRITKKWGGALREVFSDADTFGVEYTDSPKMGELRTALICATFLIDFTCFENNHGSSGLLDS